MNIRKRHLFRWIVVGLAVAATAAPAARPDVSPDDRALNRSVSATLAPTSLSPDDRPFSRLASATIVAAAVSPDDRSFSRLASATIAPTGVSPDDRPFMRSVGDLAPRTVPIEVVSSPGGFDWRDAAIGSAFGLTIALLGMGLLLIATRGRKKLSPA